MEWLQSEFIYTVTKQLLDNSIEQLFTLASDVIEAFSLPIEVAAGIYIALMGYSLSTGIISMSQRDVATRFAKVIGILVLLETFQRFGIGVFSKIWEQPDNLADYMGSRNMGNHHGTFCSYRYYYLSREIHISCAVFDIPSCIYIVTNFWDLPRNQHSTFLV